MEDTSNYYALRVTPYPNNDLSIKELRDSISQLFKGNYCFGVEFSKNHHIHAVFKDEEYDKDDFKKSVYSLLYSCITDCDNTKVGNAVFSCTSVQSLEKAVQYALKDGKTVCEGTTEWENFCEEEKKNSFALPQSIKELMDDLYSRFESDELNERSLWIEMVLGRAQFSDTKTRYGDIDAFIETFKIRKLGREYVTDIWEQRHLQLQ